MNTPLILSLSKDARTREAEPAEASVGSQT